VGFLGIDLAGMQNKKAACPGQDAMTIMNQQHEDGASRGARTLGI
jgi:hypothetical protein